MATAKKKTANRGTVHNPPRSKFASTKKTTSARSNPATKRKGSTGRSTTATRSKKRNPARRGLISNPGPTLNAAFAAIGGALAIVAFDEAMTRFLPAFSAPLRIGIKVAAGWAVGNFGRKYLGTWAGVAQGAIWLVAAKEAFDTYVRPQFAGYLSPVGGTAAIVSEQAIQNTATGEIGRRLVLSDGNVMDVFEGSAATAWAN